MDSPLPKHGFNPTATQSCDLVAPDEAARLLDIGKAVSNYVDTSKAPNTRKAYRADWNEFKAWCARYRRQAIPALAHYLADESLRLKVSTLERRPLVVDRTSRFTTLREPRYKAILHFVPRRASR